MKKTKTEKVVTKTDREKLYELRDQIKEIAMVQVKKEDCIFCVDQISKAYMKIDEAVDELVMTLDE